MAVAEGGARRRRRQPEDARREILDAATELLATVPAHEVTVAAIMGRTTLSRKSFYVYFRDRAELVAALVHPLRVEADAGLAQWAAAVEPVAAGRTALRAAAETYRRHGAILRVVFWAATGDPDIRRVRDDLTAAVVDVAVAKVEQASAGLADPRATAIALVTMNIHRLLALDAEATDTELDELVGTLSTIWERTLRL
ncbi:TetR/AcrR family transcriptional regulator [Nocardia sp. alder85J]|uniref:TetR/AcrR family transcriptional regulator n=1 Tax=Nocardia sp. alder85J TaxID=2862949 RepID=UPI001CD54744|nr:TetR/AcrR family transcriptional regulator [Nocardia sp. alder85J]MCX4093003.1 TetR family transcriptional regulator [Nocardia sp. alder85J]